MSLKLSKINVSPYDYLSLDGAMTNAVTRSVIIDKTGGTKESASLLIYLVAEGTAQIGSYSGISIVAADADANADGITWQLSLNGSTWSTSVSPSDMNCESADAVTNVYVRISVDNSEATVAATGNYAAKFTITATENPPA